MGIMPLLAEGVAPRYRVERFIAEGGMGCVFEGFDQQLRIRVALKVLKPDRATAITAERFMREARAQAQASHPNIVRIYDALETPNGLLVLVMEFVDGPTLQQVLGRGPLSPRQVREFGSQLLSALQRLHEHDYVHRDIKPSNIFVRDNQALLGDFGIASANDPEASTLTGEGSPIGTLLYMPSEQLAGRADERSDIFALGLVLWECMARREPIEVRQGSAAAWRGVPSDLRRVLRKALRAEPAERWQTAADFRLALEAGYRRQQQNWYLLASGFAVLVLAMLFRVEAKSAACRITRWRAFCPVAPTYSAELAILPFEMDGGGVDGVRLAKMVSENLNWFSPVIKLMPISKAVAWWESLPAASREQRPPGVRLYTEGSVSSAGRGLEVQLKVLDSSSVMQVIRAREDSSDIQRLAYALADSIVRKVFPSEYQVFHSLAYRMDDRQAIAEFLQGRDTVAKGHWADGEILFRKALERDPGFMPAAWELMITRRFQRTDYSKDLQFIARHIDSFPPFYKRLAVASLTPDLRERMTLFQDEVRTSRQNGTALLLYGNELFHRGSLVGRPLKATVDSLEEWARTEPGMNHASTYDMAWWGNLRLGNEAGANLNLANREALGLPAGDTYKPFQHLGTYARFAPWKASLARTILLRNPSQRDLKTLSQFARLGTLMDIPDEQLALGAILTSKSGNTDERAAGRLGLAGALQMLGRPGESLLQFDRGAEIVGTPEMLLQQSEWPLQLFALGLLFDSARVQTARDWLVSAPLSGTERVRALYALGRDAMWRGDTARAAELVAQLGAMEAPPSAARHAILLGAELTAARGNPAAALEQSSVIFIRDTSVVQLSPFARAATYLARGRWRLLLDDADGADREWFWYEAADFDGWPVGAPQAGEVDAIVSVYARLLRGELEARRENSVAACPHLTRVRELWRGAEPVMRSYQARADSAWRAACQ